MPKHRFHLDFYPSKGGDGLSVALPRLDFRPAVEYVQFEALQSNCGQFPTSGRAVVEPVYTNGGPTLAGLRMTAPVSGGGSFTAGLTLDYFTELAELYHSALVKAGKLPENEEQEWIVSAMAGDDGIDCERPAVELNLEIHPACLRDYLERSEPVSVSGQDPFPVFLPRVTLTEIGELAREAAPKECGGVLLGHLLRDSEGGRLFVEVTAQTPALQAVGGETELRFGPDAWQEVRAAIRRRNREEIWVGWWHSHTPFSWADKCGSCPLDKQRRCELATRLFSPQDRALHTAVAGRALHVATVANVLSGGEVSHACFGWREGRIRNRGYWITEV
jgi:proteasome lid subunit RPN8/RPN11